MANAIMLIIKFFIRAGQDNNNYYSCEYPFEGLLMMFYKAYNRFLTINVQVTL